MNKETFMLSIRDYLKENDLPPMYAHQQKAVNTTELTDAALIIRGAGSGKTRIGIEIVKKYLKKDSHVVWVCPAALISQNMEDFTEAGIPNYKFESSEGNIEKGKVTFISYALLKRNLPLFTSINWDLGISDEFHRTRNKGTVINEATWFLRKKCKRFYALTATPFNNYSSDFFEILSIVIGVDIVNRLQRSISFKGKKSGVLFGLYKFIAQIFFGKKIENNMKAKFIFNKNTINTIIDSYIDYVAPEEYLGNIKRPKANSKIEYVELNKNEVKQYKKILKNRKIRNKEMYLRIFLLREGSSKIVRAAKQIKDILKSENKKIIVFSNFVENGLGSLSKELEKTSVEFEVYEGSTNKEKRDIIKTEFTKGDLKVLLISPSGFEGLNLKGATDCIVLDPHYNPAKTEQIISRGLRAGSKVEKVNIFHYCATSSKLKVQTVDEKIMRVSGNKQEMNKAMENLIKDVKKGKKP